MRLHDFLEFYARETPDHVFGEFVGTQFSYKSANARANQFARALQASGAGHGKRFAYLSKNSLDFCLMYYAAAKCGAIPVPLNYRLAPAEWAYIINDSQACMVLASTEFQPGINQVRDELSAVDGYISTQAASGHWPAFENWLSGHPDHNLDAPITEDDQLYQMYTSGTTGHPKGVVLSHRAVISNLRMWDALMPLREGSERMLIVAPLYHAAAAVVGCMFSISHGSTLVVHADFIPRQAVDSLIADNITAVGMVPAMIQACLVMVPDIAERKFPELRQMGYGASPIAAQTLQQAMNIFQCDFVQGFGMTETSSLACGLSARDHQRALNDKPELLRAAGRPVLGTEIKIIADGKELSVGEVGEIVLRGPQLMDGYWNLPEATSAALQHGWMHTGDAGSADEEGYIYIKDRIKDMIVSGGENVYPAEVENALFKHTAVGDAAVIGIPSERWGETILAFVVLREGQVVEPESLREHCREHLAGYKVPAQIEFIGELPRNASGKVLKKNLREPYWKGHERRVG